MHENKRRASLMTREIHLCFGPNATGFFLSRRSWRHSAQHEGRAQTMAPLSKWEISAYIKGSQNESNGFREEEEECAHILKNKKKKKSFDSSFHGHRS
jgi:hypothetical protein